MKSYARDWPPDNPPKAQPSGPMLEVLIAFLMAVVAPLAAWFFVVLPGDHPWALAVWPAGWALAVVVLFTGNYIRQRKAE